jgi:hypothetical protein
VGIFFCVIINRMGQLDGARREPAFYVRSGILEKIYALFILLKPSIQWFGEIRGDPLWT